MAASACGLLAHPRTWTLSSIPVTGRHCTALRLLSGSAIQRMIDECLGHPSKVRKHPQGARFDPV